MNTWNSKQNGYKYPDNASYLIDNSKKAKNSKQKIRQTKQQTQKAIRSPNITILTINLQ